MSESPVVQINNLTKRYGEFVALDSLTMSVDRGHILGFIGPNGAGKTTTIKILVGLSKPTEGQATIAGADCVKDTRQIKRLVGYMPDTFGSYENMRVREYLDFFGAAFKIPRKDRLKRIDECLEITGSSYMKDRYVEALSHGMKQRVGIARTLLHNPEVLILDEPANGLDPQARIEMRQILLRLAEMGKTLIVTSHILPELSRICDTVSIVIQGQLRAFGTLEEIMRKISQRRIMEVQLTEQAAVQKCAELIKQHVEDDSEITPSEAEAEVRFTTSRDDGQLAELLALLGQSGLKVVQFREVPLDLEDAFLSVTREMKGGSGDRPGGMAEPAGTGVAAAEPAKR
ncbi:ABC transporter ATP-binding protein [Phycisphaerales bacterium AB-hyl4]|uniref:ABC transporter ATP-binding protein n=1 Tax=Natronomicrosphaera hydrolytica TaxID=3242702 RepID=A0ABV4UAV4_9BACT